VTSIGSLVTTMIASSGDEAFVMLAVIPDKFLQITIILVIVGLIAGWVTDQLFRKSRFRRTVPCHEMEIHKQEECVCFNSKSVITQLKNCSLARGSLIIALTIIMVSFLFGIMGPPVWNWVRITLIVSSLIGLSIVVTVPEHFLEEHLWKHVARKHLPRIFVWTLCTLVVLAILQTHLDVELWMQKSRLIVLLIACLVGIIPESGPHMVFLTMYSQGLIPFSVLLANSVVQDGHGMMPLLAHSRRDFAVVKSVNFLVGLLIGLIGILSLW